MFFIREINPLSFKLLERIYRQSRHHQVRQRAHFLIIASPKVKIEELMTIFQVSYKTIYNWLNRWESEGIVGLYNKPRRGRKRTFNHAQEETIKKWALQEPRQFKKIIQLVKEEWGIEISAETIKRILKKFSMRSASDASRCWRRARPRIIQEKAGTVRRI